MDSMVRTPRTRAMGRRICLALIVALLILGNALSGPAALADSTTIDFESYTTGTINGQDGWNSTGTAGSGCAIYDHAVAPNTYGYAAFGTQSLRISNAVTSGCFSDQTFSRSLADEAGETSADSTSYSGGTRQPFFTAQWDFASTVPTAEQPGLALVASPDRGDGARMSWVQLADKPDGLAVNFYDYQPSVSNFVLTNVASGLDRSVTHTLKISMLFVDGPDNDVMQISVDGVLKHTGTSWEDYFRDQEGNPTHTVDSILFRTAGAAAPATAGKGFLIDNLRLFSGPVPQCTSTCYVDAAAGNDAFGGDSPSNAKRTIQAGIDQVDSGGAVSVASGTYTETLTIGKPLSLAGAQAGVLAKGRAGAQSIVRVASGGTGAITIDANQVSIDGFQIDMTGATAPWAISATNGPGSGRYSDMQILNNEFIGTPSSGTTPGGLYLLNQDDPLIEGNYFNHLGNSAVFLAGSSTNAVYRNNDSFANYNSNLSTHDGIHTNLLIEHNRAVQDDLVLFQTHGASIRDNTVTGAPVAASQIFLGGGDSDITISGNTLTNVRSQAIRVSDLGFYPDGNRAITITDNIMNVDVASQAAAATPWALIDLRAVGGSTLVRGNRVALSGSLPTGVTGIYGIGLQGAMGTATIAANELDGGGVDTDPAIPSAGIQISSTLAMTSVVQIANNRISGFINGVEAPSLPSGTAISVNQNSLAGNSGAGVSNGAGATIDASANWWGSSTGPASAANPGGSGAGISTNAGFEPWLCDGTDTSAAVGFQPNANQCSDAPPETAISGKPSNPSSSSTAAFVFSGSDDVTPPASLTFECKLDGGAFAACTSAKTYTGLVASTHTFQVRAKDQAGQLDPTPASYTWRIPASADTTTPDTTISGKPASTSGSATAAFTFSGSDNLTAPASLTFECQLDGAAFAACTSPRSYSALSNGAHTFKVRARDAAGNLDPTPASYTWTVQVTAHFDLYLPIVAR